MNLEHNIANVTHEHTCRESSPSRFNPGQDPVEKVQKPMGKAWRDGGLKAGR